MIEPMIKPTFVIVILGILASVAIPRLAATKADAEISAAVANLRTLVSDASVYLVTKGEFSTSGVAATKWNEITNVPLENAANAATTEAHLKVGNQNCIGVQVVNKTAAAPAYIKFTKSSAATGICTQVQNAEPLKPYFNSTVAGVTTTTPGTSGAIAIGSSTNIYTTAP